MLEGPPQSTLPTYRSISESGDASMSPPFFSLRPPFPPPRSPAYIIIYFGFLSQQREARAKSPRSPTRRRGLRRRCAFFFFHDSAPNVFDHVIADASVELYELIISEMLSI